METNNKIINNNQFENETQLQNDNDQQIKIFQTKQLIKKLQQYESQGTSMISFLMSPKKQLQEYIQQLQQELGTAQNIKNRVNRQSVCQALQHAIQKLKLYKKIPQNGLIIYSGIFQQQNKDFKLLIDYEPPQLLQSCLYKCDNKFHVQHLQQMLQNDDKYGFIIIDGNGTLFAVMQGNNIQIIQSYEVSLPNKHNKGGQSALRFSRLRDEKRNNYVTKICEFTTKIFITNDTPNVNGIIIAGSAMFKNVLYKSDKFDKRLFNLVICQIDINYGQQQGLYQAIQQSQQILQNVKFIQEKQIIQQFMDHLLKDDNLYVYGKLQTYELLNQGLIETLICYEDMTDFLLLTKKQQNNEIQCQIYQFQNNQQINKIINNDVIIYDDLYIDWLIQNYIKFGVQKIHLIKNYTPEGQQFCNGFQGLAGILKYPYQLQNFQDDYNFQQNTQFDDAFI